MNDTNWSLALRITSISVGIYEYILTLPAEWNFYFGYKRRHLRWDVGAILFGLIRYVTIMAITFNNVGYFVEGFSVEQCKRFHVVSPVLKVVQAMISQTILGLRTHGISGRNKKLGVFLLTFWIICAAGEWFMGLYGREFLQNQNMNCIATNDPDKLYTWGFYLIAMVYDLVTFSISIYHLLYRFSWECVCLYKFSRFMRLLIVDGMQYFVALTAVNILNLIVYRSGDMWIQSSAAPFGYLITWIMSQRILIHMRESARAGNQVLPVTSADLVFNVGPGNEHDVPGRQGEKRPRPRYEGTGSEDTLGIENTSDPGIISPSMLDDHTPPGGPRSSKQSDNDDDNNDDTRL